MAENQQSHLNGHTLANISDSFENMWQQAQKDQQANKGYVWTISFDQTSTINALGLADCDYTLHLSASHVGETMLGVYCGEMDFRFKGETTGLKFLLGALGIGSSEDLQGWFKNDRFVMRLSNYDETNEKEFIDTFRPASSIPEAPEKTGDDNIDAAKQAGYDMAMNFLNALTNAISSPQQNDAKEQISGKKPVGMWYDWDSRMSEGDMATYYKLNGGNGLWTVNGAGQTDSEGKNVSGGATASVILAGTYHSETDEPIDAPFPYVLKAYPDGTAAFILYSSKDPNVKVVFNGTIDAIPVEETTVVK